ncbi:PqqD family protein, partial [Synechococcus lacustris]
MDPQVQEKQFQSLLKMQLLLQFIKFFNMATQQHQSPSTKRFKQHPAVVFSELDNQITLFQSKTCDYLVLNETGSAIWQALQTAQTLNQICDLL